MDLRLILQYLDELSQNNSRDWFHAHKSVYREAGAAFEELVRTLTVELHTRGGGIPLMEPKELTFKLMRDTRFSRDKSPYNPAFRAHMGPQGKLPIPVGYYLQIKPGNQSFLGGGLFADMFKDATTMVRDAIAAHGEEWAAIVNDPDFRERFHIGGIALKNIPRGYDAAHPQADYLKNKSWFLEIPVPDERLLQSDFVEYAADTFLKMKPFHDFLNRALAGFQMPAR